MRVDAPDEVWSRFLGATDTFWTGVHAGRPRASGTVVTEVFSQHLRVAVRNVSVANALRSRIGGPLLVVTGADRRWMGTVWADLDLGRVTEYARASGGHLFDIQEAARQLAATRHGKLRLTAMGKSFTADLKDLPDERDAGAVVRSTWSRVSKSVPYAVPPTGNPDYESFRRHARSLMAVWNALLEAVDAAAFVTSHVDYDQWAPAVTAMLRRRRPVIHVQSTGGLKAYAVWPQDVDEHRRSQTGTIPEAISSHAALGPTFRSVLTPLIGQVFDKLVSEPRRDMDDQAELVTARSKMHLGRPSWWRSGANATLDLRDARERRQFREFAASGLRMDSTRPVVAVFNHAISDAVNTNVEAFDDLSTWFERTVEYAATRTDVAWLFLDHPSQELYDQSGFFESLADRFPGEHLTYRRSDMLTKNTIWSLVDLGVTVRGSISNELPAFGVGVIQAGWSEWSHCGVSHVGDDQQVYWQLLDQLIERARFGRGTATLDQMRRGRLWQWFYRVAADVNTAFVPHWAALEGPEMLSTLSAALEHAIPEGDPLFESTARLWTNRDCVLSRFDFAASGVE